MDEKVIQTEHLTREQLIAYSAGTFESKEQHIAAGRHILQCAECLAALPAPTPERFLAVLFDEDELDQDVPLEQPESPLYAFPLFSHFFSAFLQPKTLAFGGGALLILLSFSMFLLLTPNRQASSPRETAFERDEANVAAAGFASSAADSSNSLPGGQSTARIDDTVQPKNNLLITEATTSKAAKQQTGLETAKTAKKVETEQATKEPTELARLKNDIPKAISSASNRNAEMVLRGNNQTENQTSTFSLLAPVGETSLSTQPLFRWEKVAGAKSYRISIFDAEFNEVLTADSIDNSFRPDKPLERGKRYLWRVAAQTDAGEIVAPRPPQSPAVFQIADEKNESRSGNANENRGVSVKLAAHYLKFGMLDSADDVLQKILADNPKNQAAQRLLAKLEKRRAAFYQTTQRCAPSPPTATKPAQ